MSKGQAWVSLLLGLAVVVSGVGVVYAKYLSRKHFMGLETLRTQRDRIDIQWGRLQLEEAALSTHGRVESKARKLMQMRVPRSDALFVVREVDGTR